MNRIQKLRKEAGLTQVELAKMIGVNPVTMSRYESGDRSPKIDKLEKMSEIFTASVAYITGESDSRIGVNNGIYAESWDTLAEKMNSYNNGKHSNAMLLTKEQAAKELLRSFEKLNFIGRKEALKQVINLTKIKDYTDE